VFTVKSACHMSIASQVRNRDPIWRLIWSWKGSERIRAFLWGG